MPGWDGKKAEPMERRVYVCAGCRELGGTLVRVGIYLLHDRPTCRLQLQRHIARAQAEARGELAPEEQEAG
jgi:hypothetical protein